MLDSALDQYLLIRTFFILEVVIHVWIFEFQHFAHNKKSGSVGSFDLNKGTNRFCLAQPGVYKLRPDSCHKFEKEEYIYDTYVCAQSVNR